MLPARSRARRSPQRATLSEILALVPREHQAFSATTDGLLTTCRPEALRSGRVSRLFADARVIVADSRDIVEAKHKISGALVWKTRGTISTEPFDSSDPGEPVIARAGHRLDPRPEDPWRECREWALPGAGVGLAAAPAIDDLPA